MTKMTLAAVVPFGLVMGAFLGLQHGPAAGLVVGAGAGLMFGALLTAFAEGQRRRMKIASGVLDGEPIVRQGPANHWRGVEARGGWLVLTTRRLVFRSHGKNVQNEGAELPLAEVAAVEPSRSLGIVPNGLRVRRKDGAVERFVVAERGEWLAALTAALRRPE